MAIGSVGEKDIPAAGGGFPAAAVAGSALLVLAAAVPLALLLGLVPGHSEAFGRVVAVTPFALGMAGGGLLAGPIRRRPAVLSTCFGCAWALLLTAYFRREDGLDSWIEDPLLFYRMAAEWPWRPDGWWRYRVLVPTLIRFVPLSTNLAYLLLAGMSIAAAAPVLSLLLRDLGYGTPARHAGVLLYLASFAPLYNAYRYALPDPAAMVVLLLAARALVRRRDWEFALWLVVGCLTKEVVLFLVPVRWLLRRAEEGDRRGLWRTALVAAPAGALFLALRAMPAEAANYSGFVTGAAWLYPWKYETNNIERVYSPFAAGWALLLVSALRPSGWVRAGAAFGILVLASLLVTDSGRILVYLIPFAVPMMLDGAGMAPGSERASRESMILVALACISMRMWEPFLLFWRIPEGPRRLAALALFPVLAVLALRARRGGPAPSGS